MRQLERPGYGILNETGEKARALLLAGELPQQLQSASRTAYKELCDEEEIEVAVRNNATAEDLPHASFSSQHESYLNIKGEAALLSAVKKCYASFYTDRAIKYREEKGFEHQHVDISVGVQKMVM